MPFLLLSTSLLVLSFSAIFIRLAEAHVAAIGFWRLAISVPILLFLLFWKKRSAEILQLHRRQWLGLFLCGFFLFAHFYTWFLSIQKTSVANAMILFASNPVYTAIGAWIFFREKVYLRHVFALLFCLLGLFFLVRDSLGSGHMAGDFLAFLCAILFSAYVLSGKHLRQGLHNIPFALTVYSFCWAWFTGVMLFLGVPFWGYSAKTWLAFFALAVGSTLLGHSLFTHCLQFFNVNLMSISTLSEPVVTATAAHYIFGDPITSNMLLGFLFVCAGILVLYAPFLFSLRKNKKA